MIDDLLISTDGHLGRISLNRPAAINALSLGMIEGIKETLRRWSADDGIGAIVFEGIGPKGFCAGGDVRAARSLVIGGQPEQADAYFASEYEMNRMIATYAKPLVALGHGITMGGGIGIAGHCRFRFTQPGARFAMPESAIGFFGDVGVSAILAKAPLNRALLFMMSGVSVGAADALALGLADAVIAPEQVADLRADLVGAAASADPAAAIGRLMEANSVVAGEANAIGWDIVTAWPEDLVAQADSLAKLDCSRLTNLSQAVDGACTERGLLRTMGGVSIVYDAKRFPQGGPQTWADFWDVKRFPGPRAMPNAGAPWWPLMAALMADGVPRDKLFPLDLDRAFKKLDELRPSIAVWWRTGDKSMQLLRSNEVVMAMMWSGSGFVLKDQGLPISVVWNDAVPNIGYWAMLKGGANQDKAYAFLDYYLTRPEAHLNFANAFKYDTSNRNMLALLSPEDRAARGSAPENMAKMAVIDPAWIAANRAAVIERWNRWLSR